jgi:hypothetical protein
VRRKIMGDDLLMMKDGQMLILRDGEMIGLLEDMILPDGTRITMDGRVIMFDGTYELLVEGQTIIIDNRETVL